MKKIEQFRGYANPATELIEDLFYFFGSANLTAPQYRFEDWYRPSTSVGHALASFVVGRADCKIPDMTCLFLLVFES